MTGISLTPTSNECQIHTKKQAKSTRSRWGSGLGVFIFLWSSVVLNNISLLIINKTTLLILNKLPLLRMTKQRIYEANIKRSVTEMYHHMENTLLGWLKDGDEVDEENLTDEQIDSIFAVQAIEEEWVLDPDIRQEMTLLTFIEEDNSDD